MDDHSVVEATPKAIEVMPKDMLDEILRTLHNNTNHENATAASGLEDINNHNRDVQLHLMPQGIDAEEKIEVLARLIVQANNFYDEGIDVPLTDKEWVSMQNAERYLWIARYLFNKLGQ